MGAIHSVCPHVGASLAHGVRTQDCIQCPFHAWRFDNQGILQSTDSPQSSPSVQSSFRYKIPSLELKLEGEKVWMKVPQKYPKYPSLIEGHETYPPGWYQFGYVNTLTQLKNPTEL